MAKKTAAKAKAKKVAAKPAKPKVSAIGKQPPHNPDPNNINIEFWFQPPTFDPGLPNNSVIEILAKLGRGNSTKGGYRKAEIDNTGNYHVSLGTVVRNGQPNQSFNLLFKVIFDHETLEDEYETNVYRLSINLNEYLQNKLIRNINIEWGTLNIKKIKPASIERTAIIINSDHPAIPPKKKK